MNPCNWRTIGGFLKVQPWPQVLPTAGGDPCVSGLRDGEGSERRGLAVEKV